MLDIGQKPANSESSKAKSSRPLPGGFFGISVLTTARQAIILTGLDFMEREAAEKILDQMMDARPFNEQGNISTLSKGEAFVLFLLWKDSRRLIKAGDIASEAEISTARVAVILNSLEKKELVCRLKSKSDSRVTYISMTGKGADYVSAKREKAISAILCVCDEIGEDEFRHYLETSRRIKNLFANCEKKKPNDISKKEGTDA